MRYRCSRFSQIKSTVILKAIECIPVAFKWFLFPISCKSLYLFEENHIQHTLFSNEISIHIQNKIASNHIRVIHFTVTSS